MFEKWIIFVAIAFTTIACSKGPDSPTSDEGDTRLDPNVIYGEDNRLDLYQVDNPAHLAMASATVALIESNKVVERNDSYSISSRHYGRSNGLCTSEAFYDQRTAPFCSGFLVSEDTIVTAGHCITSLSRCRGTKFVFGYGHTEPGQDLSEMPKENVYYCNELVASEVERTGVDYAVIKLDRPVVGRDPVPYRMTGQPEPGTPLVVIGHPVGLPTKVAAGASVMRNVSTHFFADLDTYGGNSGSAVFNADTGVVEGILVRGETDFVSNGRCAVSNVCDEDNPCSGEQATHMSQVAEHLPPSVDPGDDGPGDDEPGDDEPDDENPVDEEPDDEEPSTSRYQLVEQYNQSIPDNSRRGTDVSIDIKEAVAGRRVLVGVDIAHTWKGDLQVEVVSPSGRSVILHNRSGRSEDNIFGVYGHSLESVQSLDSLGDEPAGEWILRVRDLARQDRGRIRQFGLFLLP